MRNFRKLPGGTAWAAAAAEAKIRIFLVGSMGPNLYYSCNFSVTFFVKQKAKKRQLYRSEVY
jgi:hypothetical protein